MTYNETAFVLIEIEPNSWHDKMDVDYLVNGWCEDHIDGDWSAEIWDDDGQMMGELRIQYPPSQMTRGYLDLNAWVDMVESILGSVRVITKTAR